MGAPLNPPYVEDDNGCWIDPAGPLGLVAVAAMRTRAGADPMSRSCYLSTFDLFRLDRACVPLRQAHGYGTFLVGTAQTGPSYRDVDVRTILDDDVFDRLFPTVEVWQLASVSVTAWLHLQTGLPIDFQYQRRSEANDHQGPRNPLGAGLRRFAAAGDATWFPEVVPDD